MFVLKRSFTAAKDALNELERMRLGAGKRHRPRLLTEAERQHEERTRALIRALRR